ncbi:MAG: glycosyltransferase [Bacteroidetes bacterium]|nr:glycosyltransferase [Bacteroidota bacterium]
MKKILFVTGNFLPHKNGGIENYTFKLCQFLSNHNFRCEVAALNAGNDPAYIFENFKVYNLKNSLGEFERILEQHNFDICHIHEYSMYGGIELDYFYAVKNRGIKVFFTFHLPYLTCYKNDFRFLGLEDCNLFINPSRCAKCVVTTHISNRIKIKNNILAEVIKNISPVVPKTSQIKKNVIQIHQNFGDLFSICDKVFYIAPWFKALINSNNYNFSNFYFFPHSFSKVNSRTKERFGEIKFRLLFAGRIQHQKGLHLLCLALKLIKGLKLELDVYGNIVDLQYFEKCKALFDFNYNGIISREQLLNKMNDYDFLVLPSIFTEMYPMVIHEAFSVSLPVIASSAKGNSDIIIDSGNGFIFNYDDFRSLHDVLKKSYDKLRNGWEPSFNKIENSTLEDKAILSFYNDVLCEN